MCDRQLTFSATEVASARFAIAFVEAGGLSVCHLRDRDGDGAAVVVAAARREE